MPIHHDHKKHLHRHGLHDTVRAHDEMYNIFQAYMRNADIHKARLFGQRLSLGSIGMPSRPLPRSRAPSFGMNITMSRAFEDDASAPQFDNVPRKKKNNPFGAGMPTEDQLRRL